MSGVSLGSIGEENNFENRRIDATDIILNDNDSDGQREGAI